MGSFFKGLFEAVRRLPVAKYLKPLWKGALLEAVQAGGDALQASLRVKLASEGPSGLNAAVDRWQEDVSGKLAKLPLPSSVKDRCSEWVRFEGDRLQQKLVPAAVAGGVDALDSVFDESQAVLRSKIESL